VAGLDGLVMTPALRWLGGLVVMVELGGRSGLVVAGGLVVARALGGLVVMVMIRARTELWAAVAAQSAGCLVWHRRRSGRRGCSCAFLASLPSMMTLLWAIRGTHQCQYNGTLECH
jgi:hypothetical protein